MFVAALVCAAASLQPAAAQEQSPFVLRVLQLNSDGRYTCTALMEDRELEQLTVITNRGVPPPTELRRGLANDEDMKKAEELLQQPEFRSAAADEPNIPQVPIQRDGEFIMVLGRIDGVPKIVQFSDPEGKKSKPKYFKGFETFAENIRKRKLQSLVGKVTPRCKITVD